LFCSFTIFTFSRYLNYLTSRIFWEPFSYTAVLTSPLVSFRCQGLSSTLSIFGYHGQILYLLLLLLLHVDLIKVLIKMGETLQEVETWQKMQTIWNTDKNKNIIFVFVSVSNGFVKGLFALQKWFFRLKSLSYKAIKRSYFYKTLIKIVFLSGFCLRFLSWFPFGKLLFPEGKSWLFFVCLEFIQRKALVLFEKHLYKVSLNQ